MDDLVFLYFFIAAQNADIKAIVLYSRMSCFIKWLGGSQTNRYFMKSDLVVLNQHQLFYKELV